MTILAASGERTCCNRLARDCGLCNMPRTNCADHYQRNYRCPISNSDRQTNGRYLPELRHLVSTRRSTGWLTVRAKCDCVLSCPLIAPNRRSNPALPIVCVLDPDLRCLPFGRGFATECSACPSHRRCSPFGCVRRRRSQIARSIFFGKPMPKIEPVPKCRHCPPIRKKL